MRTGYRFLRENVTREADLQGKNRTVDRYVDPNKQISLNFILKRED